MKLKRKKRNFFIPLSSMSDVAFLLLIFIMLATLINYRREVKIDYPEARAVLRTSADKNLEVWVDREGAIYLDGERADIFALEEKIFDLYRIAPDTRVHIIADRSTPYENIDAVLEVLQFLQYRLVSFVVKSSE